VGSQRLGSSLLPRGPLDRDGIAVLRVGFWRLSPELVEQSFGI
jgi:hypothetical protein